MDTPVNAKAALLQALTKGPGYGLELVDRVKQQTKGAMELGNASTYPALRALEAEGFVESYDSEPMAERGGRPRRYYKITAKGRKAAYENRTTALSLFGGFVPEGA
jgi:PadR family transcriptional regulator PadR